MQLYKTIITFENGESKVYELEAHCDRQARGIALNIARQICSGVRVQVRLFQIGRKVEW